MPRNGLVANAKALAHCSRWHRALERLSEGFLWARLGSMCGGRSLNSTWLSWTSLPALHGRYLLRVGCARQPPAAKLALEPSSLEAPPAGHRAGHGESKVNVEDAPAAPAGAPCDDGPNLPHLTRRPELFFHHRSPPCSICPWPHPASTERLGAVAFRHLRRRKSSGRSSSRPHS